MPNKNDVLHKARGEKNDEFYTQLSDIENELRYYKKHFKNKIIYCNCDNPEWSNFWLYFKLNFKKLELRKIISSHYDKDVATFKLEYDGNNEIKTQLNGNGDFRSEECINILKEADVVVTNPPFSLFREYIKVLMKYEKKFIIIGHQNALKYKDVFPFIKNNKIWLGNGFSGNVAYFINKNYEDYATYRNHKEGMIRVSGVVWYTNLTIEKRHNNYITGIKYKDMEYKKYDNSDIINIDKCKHIPDDYYGIMGVPITFMEKYNPEQYQIVDMINRPVISGKIIYTRILIKKINV